MIPRRLFVLLDLFTLYLAFVAAYACWPHVHAILGELPLPAILQPAQAGGLPALRELSWMFILFAVTAAFMLGLVDAYRPLLQQSYTRVVVSSFLASVAATGVLTTSLFALRRLDWSRLFVFSVTSASILALLVVRLSLRTYLHIRRKAGFYAKNVLLIGDETVIDWLSVYFRNNVSPAEYRLIGYLAVSSNSPGDLDQILNDINIPRMGMADQLGNLLIREPIHEVLAVQSSAGAEWMPQAIESCDSLGVLLRIIPQGLLFGKTKVLRNLYPFQLLHLPAVVLAPPHFDSDAMFVKRVLDVVVSAFLLIVLSPLFALIAIAIKITDRKSDVFYRWNVVGRNGVRFTGFKFTTMYSDADDRKSELLNQNEMTGPVFKMREDPRITPIGRFLRKYSLNELPQLFSVLKGDMSLVGPRPAFPHELEAYGFWHKRKLSIRPGITCLWQIRGRNRISNFDDWVKMDLEYIDNWSLWLDCKILARTAWAVVAGTGS